MAILGLASTLLNWGLNQASAGIQQGYNERNLGLQNYYNKDLMQLQNAYNKDAAETAYRRQIAMTEAYSTPEAQLKMLQAAGLSPALMYGKGGASGVSVPNVQQAHPTGLPSTGLPSVTALGMSSTLAQEMKALQESEKIESEMDKLTAETDKLRAEIEKTKGETALQAWSQRQIFTISDSQLKAIEESHTWGWAEGGSENEGKSESNSENSGWTVGANVDLLNLLPGGKVVKTLKKGVETITKDKGGAGLGAKGGKTEGKSTSNSTSSGESWNDSEYGGDSHSETNSESHSRQVLTWPKLVDGKPAGLYMVVLEGDYSNISIDLREKPFKWKDN